MAPLLFPRVGLISLSTEASFFPPPKPNGAHIALGTPTAATASAETANATGFGFGFDGFDDDADFDADFQEVDDDDVDDEANLESVPRNARASARTSLPPPRVITPRLARPRLVGV